MSATPDLLYSEIEDDLRDTVRAMLAERSPLPAVLARCEGDEPYDLKLWRTLAVELGCAGLAVPEERGGVGASFREAAVVLEELGRAVAPVPFLGSAVVATSALLACGERELLGELASGARTAALALPLSSAPQAPVPPPVRAAGDALTGTVTSVADALPADVLLVFLPGALYAVQASATEVSRSPVVSLDLTRQLCDLTMDGAPGRLLASGDAADRAVSAALTTGAALLASEQLGVAQWCLETTVEHLKTRYQFGRPLGSFQALKHRLAELWVEVSQARAVARYAAACVASGDPDAAIATAVAQSHCAVVAVKAAEECVQLHGGIGFTWEHGAHLYLKRAKSDAIAFGTPDQHRAALAALVDL
jgi:alkylation response protein AidB-like acyl-CoA dehydrogenase